MTNSKIVSKEIHLKRRPTGFVTEDDFEIVDVNLPELKKEGEFLVRNIWMSIDPFVRIYMVKGSRIMPPIELDKPLNGGCIGQKNKIQKYQISSWRVCQGEFWLERVLDFSRRRQ